ncbi:hypothetical protein TNCT_456011 [Trichonephila clavata]|uniref:Uncharacterized protein n=1 Tax=Trichonephila clavata TaxID=2740835 RepID=A0A8X6HBA9_TRICU|nr:hypothetical protein TNCT_456011 [Trichonephila clavata]
MSMIKKEDTGAVKAYAVQSTSVNRDQGINDNPQTAVHQISSTEGVLLFSMGKVLGNAVNEEVPKYFAEHFIRLFLYFARFEW